MRNEERKTDLVYKCSHFFPLTKLASVSSSYCAFILHCPLKGQVYLGSVSELLNLLLDVAVRFFPVKLLGQICQRFSRGDHLRCCCCCCC